MIHKSVFSFSLWIFRTVFSEHRAWFENQMNAGHPTASQTQSGQLSLSSEPPPRRISAGWWLKQPLTVDKAAISCQCKIPCLTATHSPRALCLSAAQESKAIVPGKGGADVTAALGEKKRGHWLSRLRLFFAVQRRLCCSSEIQSGMRTLGEGSQKCFSVDNGNLCVCWRIVKVPRQG